MVDLYADYIARKPSLMAFYAGSPQALFADPPRVAGWDRGVARDLKVNGDESVVITGQQPGLFTGPLYTIYKGITAVLAAERLSEVHGGPCIPVFWVGGDDHDYEEVRSAHLLTRHHTIETLRYTTAEDVDGRSMFRVPATKDAHDLIESAQAHARGSEHAAEVASFLHDSLDEALSFSDWMARIMARLFQDTSLRVFAPDWHSARLAAKPVFLRELEDPLATTRSVNAAGTRLEALGYDAQVVKSDAECAFFLEVDQRRCKVLFEAGQFTLPETGGAFSRDELVALLETAPERFTANVALRCVVQQAIFPALAYVAGPGELAYWAQLKEVFARHEQPMPIVYPRLRAMLTNTKLNMLLSRYGLSLKDLDAPQTDLLERALRVTVPTSIRSALAGSVMDVAKAVGDLVERLEAEGPAGADLGRDFTRRAGIALKHLEKDVLYLDDTRTATTRNHVARLTNTLMPGRKPQERVLNVLSFLFEQGWAFVPRVMSDLRLDDFGLQEIEL